VGFVFWVAGVWGFMVFTPWWLLVALSSF